MIKITPEAARQITQSAHDAGALDTSLRIAARTGDDGSVEYALGFDDFIENDIELIVGGLNVLVSPRSKGLLEGITLDYVEMNPGEFQFIFIPPSGAARAE